MSLVGKLGEISFPREFLIRDHAVAMGPVILDTSRPRMVQGIQAREDGLVDVRFPGEQINVRGARFEGPDTTLSGLTETICTMKPDVDIRIY